MGDRSTLPFDPLQSSPPGGGGRRFDKIAQGAKGAEEKSSLRYVRSAAVSVPPSCGAIPLPASGGGSRHFRDPPPPPQGGDQPDIRGWITRGRVVPTRERAGRERGSRDRALITWPSEDQFWLRNGAAKRPKPKTILNKIVRMMRTSKWSARRSGHVAACKWGYPGPHPHPPPPVDPSRVPFTGAAPGGGSGK